MTVARTDALSRSGIFAMGPNKQRIRRGVNKKGRSKHGPAFVLHYHWVLRTEAYRELRPLARAVLMELKRRFNGRNNGNIYASVRDLSRELHCSKDSAGRALRELEEHGFIRCAQRSSFHWKNGMASTWILTEEKHDGAEATRDFVHWRSAKTKAGP